MANPAHVPTKETANLVNLCAIGGIPHKEIAAALGVSLNTLKKYYKAELASAGVKANAQVIGWLFQHCKKHPAACMFWLKTKAGWRETGTPQGPPSAPVKLGWVVDE